MDLTITTTPKRRILDLTPDEVRALFALTFGYAPTDQTMEVDRYPAVNASAIGFHHDCLIITDRPYRIQLLSDGVVLVNTDAIRPVSFNAWKVVGYLNSLGLHFGDTTNPAGL